jgi:hypothetical protein
MPSDLTLLERQMADVELRPFTLDEFHRRRHRKQRNRKIVTTLAGVALLAVVVAGVLGTVTSDDEQKTITSDLPSPIQPASPYVGSWESTDTDGSHQTMEIQPIGGGAYELVIHDEAASAACTAAGPATVTGTGRLQPDGTLVASAELTCDDGTTPLGELDPQTAEDLHAMLANLVFEHDPTTDQIDGVDVVWQRQRSSDGAVIPSGGAWVPIDAPATAVQLVRDVNERDADTFIDRFTADGVFSPGGSFSEASTTGLIGNLQPVEDADLVRAFMSILDGWGLDANLESCEGQAISPATNASGVDTLVQCRVSTGWTALNLEVIEDWQLELAGGKVHSWKRMSSQQELDLVDLNPRERFPLGYDDLEAWEAWLQENHPDDAARFLYPRATVGDCDGCTPVEDLSLIAPGDPERTARLGPLVSPAQSRWTVDGHEFRPNGFLPYDPAYNEEIQASIEEYLSSR